MKWLRVLLLAPAWFPPLGHADNKTVAHTEVVLLGTGMPRPDPRASGPATAVVLGQRVLLFDAGPGVMRRINEAGLDIRGPEALFITHLHSDHTLGYPDLIFTSWVMGRRTHLQAYGPPGLVAMTDHLIAAYAEDIRIRVEGYERAPADGYKVDVHEIAPGVAYEKEGVRVTAFRVSHGSWKDAYGYRIDTPDRSVVISGDTSYSEEMIRQAKGCDVLIHEVYPASKLRAEDRPGGDLWPTYMKTFHTSDVELGRIAAQVQPKLLILQHIVGRDGLSDDELVAGVRAGGFTGRTIVGHDLERH